MSRFEIKWQNSEDSEAEKNVSVLETINNVVKKIKFAIPLMALVGASGCGIDECIAGEDVEDSNAVCQGIYWVASGGDTDKIVKDQTEKATHYVNDRLCVLVDEDSSRNYNLEYVVDEPLNFSVERISSVLDERFSDYFNVQFPGKFDFSDNKFQKLFNVDYSNGSFFFQFKKNVGLWRDIFGYDCSVMLNQSKVIVFVPSIRKNLVFRTGVPFFKVSIYDDNANLQDDESMESYLSMVYINTNVLVSSKDVYSGIYLYWSVKNMDESSYEENFYEAPSGLVVRLAKNGVYYSTPDMNKENFVPKNDFEASRDLFKYVGSYRNKLLQYRLLNNLFDKGFDSSKLDNQSYYDFFSYFGDSFVLLDQFTDNISSKSSINVNNVNKDYIVNVLSTPIADTYRSSLNTFDKVSILAHFCVSRRINCTIDVYSDNDGGVSLVGYHETDNHRYNIMAIFGYSGISSTQDNSSSYQLPDFYDYTTLGKKMAHIDIPFDLVEQCQNR